MNYISEYRIESVWEGSACMEAKEDVEGWSTEK